MKKRSCLPILMAVWPYIFTAIVFLYSGENEILGLIVFLGSIVLTGAIPIANIVNACSYKDMNDDYHLAFWNMLVKLIHIPFYVGVFVFGVMLLLAAVVPGLIFITPVIVLILIVASYLLMITTSTYGINAIIRAKKKGTVSTGFVIVNIILHVFFVTDVISAIIVFVKMKSNKQVMYQGTQW